MPMMIMIAEMTAKVDESNSVNEVPILMSTSCFCISPFSTRHNRGNLSAGKCSPQAHRHK